jgi:iron complex transport system ATP-binding protein
MNALELSRVSLAPRLGEVTLTVPCGALVGLVGPNGSGKSTLLQIAAGVLVGEGAVAWQGRSLASVPILERARLTTWVPQEARFEFGFTVRDVVAQGRFAHGDDDAGVDEVLARCDLVSLANREVNRLSGGERHRVLLARAMVTQAPLQLWDEPFAALDVRHVLEGVQLARSLVQSGKTVVFSMHDLRLALRLDIVVVLDRGSVRAIGKPADVLTPELLRDVFGVRATTAPGLYLELPEAEN